MVDQSPHRRWKLGALSILMVAMTVYVLVFGISVVRASGTNLVHAYLYPYSHVGERNVLPVPLGNYIVLAYMEQVDARSFQGQIIERSQINAFTIFDMASWHGDASSDGLQRAATLTDLFRKRGVSLEAPDAIGCTPMQRAAMEHTRGLKEYLLSRGVPAIWQGHPQASVAACREAAAVRVPQAARSDRPTSMCSFASGDQRKAAEEAAQRALPAGVPLGSCANGAVALAANESWQFSSGEFEESEGVSRIFAVTCWMRSSDVECTQSMRRILLRSADWGPIVAPDDVDTKRAQALLDSLARRQGALTLPRCDTTEMSVAHYDPSSPETFTAEELATVQALTRTFERGRSLGIVLGGKKAGFVLELPDESHSLDDEGVCWSLWVS